MANRPAPSTCRYDHVTVDGQIDLNRTGLLVICGPRMSDAMRDAYDKDPVLAWERDEVGWLLRDTRTGEAIGPRALIVTVPGRPGRDNEDFAAIAPGAAVLLDRAGSPAGLHRDTCGLSNPHSPSATVAAACILGR